MELKPSREAFCKLAAETNLIAVAKEINMDLDTPVSVYYKLVGEKKGFILESVDTTHQQFGRFSFIGAEPFARLQVFKDKLMINENGLMKCIMGEPVETIKTYMQGYRPAVEDASLPLANGGMVGYLNYDIVATFDRVRGMELGEANHDPEAAKEAAMEPGLDFILGSLHNLRGQPDFYEYPYESEEQCMQLNREYLAELLELTEFPYFDVMAHIGYTSRYMHRDGFAAEITAENCRDELAAIFEALIAQGRGIEINVSGLRTGHTSNPNASALALYYDLGGGIITLGSDAHEAKDASIGIREGAELLRSIGFRYYTVFEQRKASFLPLE